MGEGDETRNRQRFEGPLEGRSPAIEDAEVPVAVLNEWIDARYRAPRAEAVVAQLDGAAP